MYLSLLASADDSNNSGSIWPTFILMGLIFGAMYFLMIRPQRRRMREAQELQRSMEEGDEVITNAGLYGFITAIDGDVIWLEIAENVEIRVARAAIAKVIRATDTPAATSNQADDSADDADES